MSAKLEVRNPRTGEVDYWFSPTSHDELAAVATTLRNNQAAWERAGVDHRGSVVAKFADAIERHRGTMFDALVRDTGRIGETAMEINAVAGSLARWSALAPQVLADTAPVGSAIPGISIGQGARPFPLVGIISPWNFPLLLSMIDAIPALLAGCAVVVKPSEVTPRFIEPLQAALDDVPELAAVVALVPGDGASGRAVIDLVDAVCFTGSVATGGVVASQAAGRFIPAFLELGGKDPAIVLGSADLDRASSALLWGSTANAGQSCQSIERIYVDERVHDEFVDALVAKTEKLAFAHPQPGDGAIGPIIAERQVDIIRDHLTDAVEKGAIVRCGGAIVELDGGLYCEPTVLTNVDHTMRVMTEETFGPILPVMSFGSVDEAVTLANDTAFGLSGAVFAGTTEEALEVARRIDAGGISINDASLTALVHDGEKHSFNRSGLGGSRMGRASILRFVRRQAFLINEGTQPDPWWY